MVGVDGVAGVPGMAGVSGVASVVGMATVAHMAVVADVAVVAATMLLPMLANQEPSVSLPLSSTAWLGSLGDFQSRHQDFIRSCNRGAVFGRSQENVAVAVGEGSRSAVHTPSPALTRSLGPSSLFPSEQEEAEIELVCTFGLLRVLLRATLLAHF